MTSRNLVILVVRPDERCTEGTAEAALEIRNSLLQKSYFVTAEALEMESACKTRWANNKAKRDHLISSCVGGFSAAEALFCSAVTTDLQCYNRSNLHIGCIA